MTRPTKEQFEEYIEISGRGVSNLFDGEYICSESKTGLTKDICKFIHRYFTDLAKDFEIDV